MPFMTVDAGDGLDGDVLDALARLTEPDVGDVDELLLHPLLEDGITEIDRVVVLLLAMEIEKPDTAAMIQRIPWVQEIMTEATLGVDEIDSSRTPLNHWSLLRLLEMADLSPEALHAFLELPWIQDELVEAEDWLTDSLKMVESSIQTVVIFVRHISEKSDYGMASILRMPFLQTLEPGDEEILEVLWATSDAGRNYTDGETPLLRLLTDPALEGGITDEDLGEVALADLRVRQPELSRELESLSWIRDGLVTSENAGILALWKLEHLGDDVFESVVRQEWVTDGLTIYESSSIRTFEQLTIKSRNMNSVENQPWHEEYILTLPDKPFMRSIGPKEAALLHSTMRLLQNGGMGEQRDLLSTILESDETQVAERLITLPLAGEVALTVVWPAGLESNSSVRRGVSIGRTMEIFEKAIRETEKFMGLPFPQKHAIVLIHHFGGSGSAGRQAFVEVIPTLNDSVSVITQAVTRAYWTGSVGWIDDGAAGFISSKASGSGPEFASPTCASFYTVYDFMRSPERFYLPGCNFSLGEGMFVDLYDRLGEEKFRSSFTHLHLRLWGLVPSRGCAGIDEGVCHLKAAFLDNAVAEDSAIAEEIINRRYYGT